MLALILPLLLASPSLVQSKIYSTRFDGTTWDDANWRLTTTNLDQGHYQSRMQLSNGYLGINLAAVGPFFEVDTPVSGDNINGWPLFDRRQTFGTIAGFWDSQPTTNGTNFEWLNQYGGESVISGVPHWSGLHVSINGQVLTASVPSEQISGFASTLDIGAGTMNWRYTWSPTDGPAVDIEYQMLVHKLYVNQAAVQLKITASRDVNATVVDLLEGDGALRTQFVDKGYESKESIIWTSVSPNGLSNVTAYLYSSLVADDRCESSAVSNFTDSAVIGSNSSTIAQALSVALRAGQTSTFTKYIGGASSDAFSDPQTTAYNASCTAAKAGYVNLLASHIAEWESIMTKDSVDSFRFPENGTLPDDENIIELQITAVTNPFHLLKETIGSNAIAAAGNNTQLDVNSIAVGGLGSDSYAGFIFWDAEVWMAPGLVVAYPQAAKQIARYRTERLPQAKANVQTAYQSSQNQTGKFSPDGAVYSWTSGRFGNCTGTGPCFDYEYHINGDIGLEVYNYWVVTGDTQFWREELFPVYDAVAQFYADVVTYNETAGKYYLYNATDPDEYANFQTNVGYTMVLMKTHIDNANVFRERLGLAPNETWANISSLIEVPVYDPANIILEYQTMNGSISVKQADVVLIDDFLDYPNPYSLSDLDYYAGKQSLAGPGMTYGVFSIIANEISPSGCSSYTYDLYGSQPYTRQPWFQFSEQLTDDYTTNGGTHPAYPFLTGIGGANRVAVFGYLGLRLNINSFNIDPSLPPQIQNLNYRTIYWNGWPINATSNATHTTLQRLTNSLPSANTTFATAAIPLTIGINSENSTAAAYSLLPNGTVTIANRLSGYNKTIPGNNAQCQPVSSDYTYSPGQFPLSAVDGATSTKWQPTQSNITSSMTVELPEPFVPVTEIRFDWAQSPPTSYAVTFSNSSSPTGLEIVNVTSSTNVSISNAYDAATADAIVAYSSNTTNATLSTPVWSGRYATLSISGNQATVGTANEKNGTGATVAEWAIVSSEGGNVARRGTVI
ncbi:hypothetical protein B0A48_04057 [Cryoendolithus antarcticus]|uniref:alpha,alpha-trehalase n=1 Tax=Cryoendolithus antarcticus TaxID=1507870 RepID=A0A1V8TH94_9PEZI|nr:hypothetical protein B0A48_04057 [Cryoendolithus antarcticus]